MPVEPLFPLEDQLRSYPGSMNVDLSHPGRVSPAFDHAELSGSANFLHYFGAPWIETVDADGNPIAFAFANKTVFKIQNGVIAVDNTFTGGVIQGLAMVNGIPDRAFLTTFGRVLIATFGPGDPVSGGTGGNATRNMALGTWTNNTNSATFLTAYGIATNSDQIGAATGTSATGRVAGTAAAPVPERKFAICPVTADPALAISWSTGQAVDNDPTWQINGIAVFEERFCIGMPQGFYIRDQQEGRWKNMTDYVIPHGVNGKVTKAGEHGVWYGTKKELYFFDGRQMFDQTPFRDMEKPRDLPQGRVSAIVDAGSRVLAVLECHDNLIDGKHALRAGAAGDGLGNGLKIFKDDGGVISELTANATDGSMATTANMQDWGNAAIGTDKLIFGYPRKLSALGVRVLLNASANSINQFFDAPETLDGAGNWVSLGTIVDGTILGTAARSLQNTGFPASSGESIIGWTAKNAYDLAQLDNFNPGAGNINMFWYRVKNGAANLGMDSTGAVAGFEEAFVVEGRPGLKSDGLLSSTTNFTSLFRGSKITRVLQGDRKGSNVIWQDRYALYTQGGVNCIGWTQSPFAGGSNSGSGFVLLGRFGQYQVMEGRELDATQQRDSRLVQITTTEPAPILAVYNLQLGDPRRLTKLMKVYAGGVFVQENDRIELQIQVDEWKVYNLGARWGSQASWDIPEIGDFWRCHLFFVLKDTTQFDPASPYWQHMMVEYQDVGDEYVSLMTARSFPTGAEVV